MLGTRAREEFNKNRKIIIREVPPVTYDEVKSYMGPFAVSNIAISKRLRHAIVELKHGHEAELAVDYLVDKKLLNCEVKASLFRQDNLLCVEGISDDWSSEDFREFVSPHGGVEKCFLWVDEEDKSLGYGFVEYVHNKDLSEVARLELDRRQLRPGTDVTRCRFVRDHVTRFDQLQSTCVVVTNLPWEVGVERFHHLLLHFGGGAIKPVKFQVGIATGTTVGRFGAAEFESPEAAKIMRKRMNGGLYPIRREEGEESMPSLNQSRAELRASFCTPGESIDDIMKNMTSLSNSTNQGKQTGTSQGVSNQAKLVHPAIQNILKNDQRALSDFQSVLEQVGSSNKDVLEHMMNNIHFQTAILSLMMSSTENNTTPYNPQKLCSLTATILKSMPSNTVNNNNKAKQSKKSRSQTSFTDSVDLNSSSQTIGRSMTMTMNSTRDFSATTFSPSCSSGVAVCNDTNVIDEAPSKLQKNVTFSHSTSSSVPSRTTGSTSSTTEITSPWKLLPSFARSRPLLPSMGTCERKTDEPYPGFDTDLAYVVHFLQNKDVPSATNVEASSQQTSSSTEIPVLCLPSAGRVGQMLPSTDQNFSGSFASLQLPRIRNFSLADHSGSWNPASQRLGFAGEHRRESMFFGNTRAPPKTCMSLDLQSNGSAMTCNKKKKWRPKVVEQCWNNLIQNDSENLSTTSRHLEAPSVAAKKRRALTESRNNVISDGVAFSDPGKFLVQGSLPTFSTPNLHPSLAGPVKVPVPGDDSGLDVAYVGQHQQGLGGLYADSLLRKRKFREVLDAQCKSLF